MSAARAAARYPIRVVSRLTGLGIDTLRAWERRYDAVRPERLDGARMYTEADIARLRLLRQAVDAGHRISRMAALTDAALRRLTAAAPPAPPDVPRRPPSPPALDAALGTLESAAVDQELSRLAATLPPLDFVRGALVPALHAAGAAAARRGGIAQEHALSAALRHLLGSFLRVHARRDAAARLLFATPPGERHEIGLLAAAMLAARQGCSVCYLGADLPAAEIVEAARTARCQVLVLGVTLTGADAAAERDLRAVARGLPARVEIWTGGPAAAPAARVLGPRAIALADFDAYLQQLLRLGERAA